MSISIDQLKPNEWREKRDHLIALLRETCLRPTRIMNGGRSIEINGGAFPSSFDFDTQKLTIWGRGNRYAGRSCTIDELIKVEKVIQAWYKQELFIRDEDPEDI